MSSLQTKGKHPLSKNGIGNALNRTPRLKIHAFDLNIS